MDSPITHSVKPRKTAARGVCFSLPCQFLVFSWALDSVSLEFRPHLFLCPAQLCPSAQHTASLSHIAPGEWQVGPESGAQRARASEKFLTRRRRHLRDLSKWEVVLLILSWLFHRPISWHFLDSFVGWVSFLGQLVKYSLLQSYFLTSSFGELLENRPFCSDWLGVKVVMLYF